jgi:hypothetical protein
MAQLFTPAPIRTVLVNTLGFLSSEGGGWQLWFSTLYNFLNNFQKFSSYPANSPLTVTGGGAMVISNLVINHAEFQQLGAAASIYLDLSFETSGAASNFVDISLPVPPSGWGELNARLIDNGVSVPAVAFISGQVLEVQKADGSNFALSANEHVFVGGTYRTS